MRSASLVRTKIEDLPIVRSAVTGRESKVHSSLKCEILTSIALGRMLFRNVNVNVKAERAARRARSDLALPNSEPG